MLMAEMSRLIGTHAAKATSCNLLKKEVHDRKTCQQREINTPAHPCTSIPAVNEQIPAQNENPYWPP